MARRAKKQARRNGGNGMPGWVWLLVGLLGGVVVAGYLIIRSGWSGGTDLLPRPDPQAQPPVATTAPEPEVAPESRRPKYEFYDVLRDKEVEIPDAELSVQAAEPPPAAAPQGVRYLLQVGAYGSADVAEAMKARIALTGEQARVESSPVEGGRVIHRVRLGPYPDPAALARAKAALAGHGIESMAIKAE